MKDAATVHTLDHTDQKRLEALTLEWDAAWAARDWYRLERLTDRLTDLSPEARRRFLYRRRAQRMQALTSAGRPVARSTAYQKMRAAHVEVAAHEAGLVDEWLRDRATGRRCKTIMAELARLDWDWSSDETRAWLRDNWSHAIGVGAAGVRAWVRERNGRQRRERDEVLREEQAE